MINCENIWVNKFLKISIIYEYINGYTIITEKYFIDNNELNYKDIINNIWRFYNERMVWIYRKKKRCSDSIEV